MAGLPLSLGASRSPCPWKPRQEAQYWPYSERVVLQGQLILSLSGGYLLLLLGDQEDCRGSKFCDNEDEGTVAGFLCCWHAWRRYR